MILRAFWATSVQHQIDHLNGVMYFDRLSCERDMLIRKAKKDDENSIFGVSVFSIPTLVKLIEAGHEIACVYSQPPGVQEGVESQSYSRA